MTEGKWIRFVQQRRDPGRKTDRWDVVSKQGGSYLGFVGWFARWRKYAFDPAVLSVFEEQCLRDIAQFCEEATAAYKAAKQVQP